MSYIYTQADLQSGMNRGIQGKQDILSDAQETMNEAVRETLTDIRIRSTRRSQPLVPNLMSGQFEYAVPQDLMGNFIIDIPEDAKRSDGEFTLVPPEQFSRSPRRGDVAIKDYDGIRSLFVFSVANDQSVAVDPLNTADTDSWQAFGDAVDVTATTDDAVKGNSSIEYSISSAGGTTAGIQNTNLTPGDLSDYLGHPANVFTYARLTSADGITNMRLRLGSSVSDYYEFIVTLRNDGSAFVNGWNPLRFDLSQLVAVGAPDVSAITYAVLYMTKSASKIVEDGYMFNLLEARKGKYANVDYYSKYGWISSTGARKENSTDSSDLLVADTDEFDLFVKKARCIAADECDLPDNQIARITKKYLDALANYLLKNPSEDKTTITTYYDYEQPERSGYDSSYF